MTISFGYNKPQVIQALRYHFIAQKELRLMIILVNIFALLSLGLYFFNKITPVAFLINSLLWIVLMASVWFLLPNRVYKSARTFQNKFTMFFNENDFTLEHDFTLENDRRRKNWKYSDLKFYRETPNFFHLYFDKKSFLLVPKDAFADSDEQSKLRHILMEKIN